MPPAAERSTPAQTEFLGLGPAITAELIRRLKTPDGLNAKTRRAEIGASLPVFGLRPIRSLLAHDERAE